jgi:hypothetical protein
VGNVRLALVAPSGHVYNLVDDDVFLDGSSFDKTYSVDTSSEAANGTWLLRVYVLDYYTDGGFLDRWQLAF